MRDTLLRRDTRARTDHTGLPPALLAQSARRLRVLALQYALVFFVSDPLLAIVFPDERAAFLASSLRWVPAPASIATALPVAAATRSRRINRSPTAEDLNVAARQRRNEDLVDASPYPRVVERAPS